MTAMPRQPAFDAVGPFRVTTTVQADPSIAAVGNNDAVVMRTLSAQKETPRPESRLRRRITTSMTTGAGQFVVTTTSNRSEPMWARQDCLSPTDNLPALFDPLPFHAEPATTGERQKGVCMLQPADSPVSCPDQRQAGRVLSRNRVTSIREQVAGGPPPIG